MVEKMVGTQEYKNLENIEHIFIDATDVTKLNIKLPPKISTGETGEVDVEGGIFCTLNDGIVGGGNNIRLIVDVLELRKVDLLIYNSNENFFIASLYGKFEIHTIK